MFDKKIYFHGFIVEFSQLLTEIHLFRLFCSKENLRQSWMILSSLRLPGIFLLWLYGRTVGSVHYSYTRQWCTRYGTITLGRLGKRCSRVQKDINSSHGKHANTPHPHSLYCAKYSVSTTHATSSGHSSKKSCNAHILQCTLCNSMRRGVPWWCGMKHVCFDSALAYLWKLIHTHSTTKFCPPMFSELRPSISTVNTCQYTMTINNTEQSILVGVTSFFNLYVCICTCSSSSYICESLVFCQTEGSNPFFEVKKGQYPVWYEKSKPIPT